MLGSSWKKEDGISDDATSTSDAAWQEICDVLRLGLSNMNPPQVHEAPRFLPRFSSYSSYSLGGREGWNIVGELQPTEDLQFITPEGVFGTPLDAAQIPFHPEQELGTHDDEFDILTPVRKGV